MGLRPSGENDLVDLTLIVLAQPSAWLGRKQVPFVYYWPGLAGMAEMEPGILGRAWND